MPRRALAPLLCATLAASACHGYITAEGQERLDRRYPADQVLLADTGANFFGVESRGSGQIRGNGVLALTASELWFSLLAPETELTIPLAAITAVELVPSHLGKAVAGRRLVLVRYTDRGAADAAAWLVADPDAWLRAIERARGRE